jgi:hypothetical protein
MPRVNSPRMIWEMTLGDGRQRIRKKHGFGRRARTDHLNCHKEKAVWLNQRPRLVGLEAKSAKNTPRNLGVVPIEKICYSGR